MRTFWLNRTACDVLNEMREVLKRSGTPDVTKAMLESLIEEIQVMFNKMEAALADKRQIKEINEERQKLKLKYKDLVEKIRDAGGEFDEE